MSGRITEGSGKATPMDWPPDAGLPTFRLHMMRGGYLLMAPSRQ